MKLSSFSSDKIFKSISLLLKHFELEYLMHSNLSLIKLFLLKIFLILQKYIFHFLSSKADSPIIIIGFFADKSFLENSCSLFIIFFISSVLLPII